MVSTEQFPAPDAAERVIRERPSGSSASSDVVSAVDSSEVVAVVDRSAVVGVVVRVGATGAGSRPVVVVGSVVVVVVVLDVDDDVLVSASCAAASGSPPPATGPTHRAMVNAMAAIDRFKRPL